MTSFLFRYSPFFVSFPLALALLFGYYSPTLDTRVVAELSFEHDIIQEEENSLHYSRLVSEYMHQHHFARTVFRHLDIEYYLGQQAWYYQSFFQAEPVHDSAVALTFAVRSEKEAEQVLEQLPELVDEHFSSVFQVGIVKSSMKVVEAAYVLRFTIGLVIGILLTFLVGVVLDHKRLS